ncbi:hypothetical protein [Salinibacter grassmerensis]|uniref:hypothetical protein n=1 Tax=Salinibacter grassmerensis TaxID=3040353 RepID=UPI0021E83886|nr:hypothetical protein [Salinibacter grassmerensis]
MRVLSESPRPASPTTFLLPLGLGPAMDRSDATGSSPSVSTSDDGASRRVRHETGSTSSPTSTDVDGRPRTQASPGAWAGDSPLRIPSGHLENLGSATAEFSTGLRRSRADRAREQVRAAKRQMRAQAETARRAQAHATGPAVYALIE